MSSSVGRLDRENELAADVIGIHPARFKLYAFAIGAGPAGLGGVLYAHFIRYVTPYDFGFVPSIYVLVMVVLGVLGTVRGAVFGACFLTLLPEVFRFVQGAVCPKDDIGRKVTAGGIIAIANWHVLSEESEPLDDEEFEAPGAPIDPKLVLQSLLPLTPFAKPR